MCDECWGASLDDRPICDPCLRLHRQPRSWLVPVGTLLLGLACTTSVLRALQVTGWWLGGLLGGTAVLGAIGAWRLGAAQDRRRGAMTVTTRQGTPAVPRGGPPYRGALQRALRRLAPPLSGSLAAFLLASVLIATALLVPWALALPRWLELEAVVGAWWAVWTGTLVVLLYRGWRLTPADEIVFGGASAPSRSRRGSWGNWGDLPGIDEGIVYVLLAIVAFLAAWVFVDFVLPLILFPVYALLVAALRRVANDEHGCEGSLGRSIGWGAIWGTIYTAPLAVVALLFR
jgi:hypothetical protein